MPIVMPSIFEDSLDALLDKLAAVFQVPGIERIQIDFSDGKFTPRKNFSISELDVLNPAYQWEAHLMVENPNELFFDAKIAGFNSVIFHYEAVPDNEKLKKYSSDLKALKLVPGLAINPETDISEIFESLPFFEQILVMGVKPGYQGQPLLAGIATKIKKLKKHSENVKIEVDGGVKLHNIKELADAGADILNVGSALFEKGLNGNSSPNKNFEELQSQLKNL
jgi:ribulose-phosphate 3-epimerase